MGVVLQNPINGPQPREYVLLLPDNEIFLGVIDPVFDYKLFIEFYNELIL